jgi:hypothetical protein
MYILKKFNYYTFYVLDILWFINLMFYVITVVKIPKLLIEF